MKYPYNEQNLLENSQHYMYTPFQGEALLRSYFHSRYDFLERYRQCATKTTSSGSVLVKRAYILIDRILTDKSPVMARGFCSQLKNEKMNNLESNSGGDRFLADLIEPISSISLDRVVATSILLHGLVASLLVEESDVDCKIWLDRIIQRFEVTKKLYDEYQPGFRKGQGGSTSINLYWLTALALCLYYAITHQIKYLSTLIKVCDLLTSLSMENLCEVIPQFGMELVLSTETIFIRMLAEAKGVAYVSS